MRSDSSIARNFQSWGLDFITPFDRCLAYNFQAAKLPKETSKGAQRMFDAQMPRFPLEGVLCE